MELPSKEVCYRALQSRDARFDGLIYVGVKTTGIYCRPVCPARTVKYENVFLKSYRDLDEAQEGLAEYFRFYNQARRHQSLGYRTPASVYFGRSGRW